METIKQVDCTRFEDCAAPLCPLADNLLHLIWYPDEDICTAKKFQTLHWVKKQKGIVKAKAPEDRFFTVEMLSAIKQVRKGIEGINPDQPLEQAKETERKWIREKGGGRVIANKNPNPRRVARAKRSDLVAVGKTAHYSKGGKK